MCITHIANYHAKLQLLELPPNSVQFCSYLTWIIFICIGTKWEGQTVNIQQLKNKDHPNAQLPSVGFWSWYRFLPAGLSHKPGDRLPLLYARPAVTLATLKRAATSFASWWTEARWVWTVCLRLTRQHRGCDLNPVPKAPESNTLTTRLPSHPFQTTWNHDHIHNHLTALVLWIVLGWWCRVQRSQPVAGQVSHGRREGHCNCSHEEVHCIPVHWRGMSFVPCLEPTSKLIGT